MRERERERERAKTVEVKKRFQNNFSNVLLLKELKVLMLIACTICRLSCKQ